MITDARVLRADTVPRDLHHRDGAIDHLSATLDPTTVSRTANTARIHGPSGAGKTTLAKYVCQKLERQVVAVRWGYVNCIGDSSAPAVMYEITRGMGLGKDLRRRGTPIDRYLTRLEDCDDHLVAVLDEVTALAEPPLLARLADVPHLALVTIAIDDDVLFRDLDERVKSRLRGAETITLERYGHDELVSIVRARIDHGLDSSRVSDAAVEEIADRAAGNARVAIALLRQAAQRVVSDERNMLTPAVVAAVADDAREDIRDRHIRSLGTHQRLLFSIIRSAGELDAGTLHERYERKADDPKTRRTRRRYLNSLRRYGLIDWDGARRHRVYRCVAADQSR